MNLFAIQLIIDYSSFRNREAIAAAQQAIDLADANKHPESNTGPRCSKKGDTSAPPR
jgi:hypothetical protein